LAAGSHNHGADVVDFYERVASAAPGSYGVLYLHDDERSVGDRNKWQVYVLRRGEVTEHADPFSALMLG